MMNLLTSNIASYLSTSWKEKYASILEPEHWATFVNRFNNYLSGEYDHIPLPYFNEEVTPSVDELVRSLQTQYELVCFSEPNSEQAWATVIQNTPFEHVLLILGQRLTSASITDEKAIPPLKKVLLESCLEAYNSEISVATRAWEKHVGRHPDNFWGEIKGSPSKKDKHTKEVVLKILENKTWWNVFHHYVHEVVYEVRVESGHGIRWCNGGNSIIGFLEPFIIEESH